MFTPVTNRPTVMSTMANRVLIFDTTLRDGEQSPGASLTSDEKQLLASQIADLGVDVIEAGFPAASPDDQEAVRRIARRLGHANGPIIAGLARAVKRDIERAWEALRGAERPRIHTFLATSDLHMEKKLGLSRAQVVDRVSEMVSYAKGFCDDVEFSPEDAGRSDREFLVQVLTVAIQAGATTLNIPDTVGYTLPDEYGALFAYLIHHTPGAESVIFSAHCHDDLGLATANSLAAIRAGARQVEVTVNGIGERAGNTSLEEIVMTLATRRPLLGLETGIDTRKLTRVSRVVSQYTGMPVPPNKAIVGRNAFAHEAGIHQDGMLKDQRTYEIMTPESVGRESSELVLGKHSGRHAFRVRLSDMGIALENEPLAEAFRRFKALAERKKVVTEADLRALVLEEAAAPPELFQLLDLRLACGRHAASATVRLQGPGGDERVGSATGLGSVDAVFGAIQKILGRQDLLLDFSIRNVTQGKDALGQVSVRIAAQATAERTYHGYATHTDVVIASAKAYLAATNRLLAADPAAQQAAVAASALAATSGREAQEAPANGRGRQPARLSKGLDPTLEEEPFNPQYTAGI